MSYQLGHSETPSAKGWECPKCNAVMSPSFPTCFYCKPVEVSTSKSTWADNISSFPPAPLKCNACGKSLRDCIFSKCSNKPML